MKVATDSNGGNQLSVVRKTTIKDGNMSMRNIVKVEPPRRSMVEAPQRNFFARAVDKIRSMPGFSKKTPNSSYNEKSDHLHKSELFFECFDNEIEDRSVDYSMSCEGSMFTDTSYEEMNIPEKHSSMQALHSR